MIKVSENPRTTRTHYNEEDAFLHLSLADPEWLLRPFDMLFVLVQACKHAKFRVWRALFGYNVG